MTTGGSLTRGVHCVCMIGWGMVLVKVRVRVRVRVRARGLGVRVRLGARIRAPVVVAEFRVVVAAVWHWEGDWLASGHACGLWGNGYALLGVLTCLVLI